METSSSSATTASMYSLPITPVGAIFVAVHVISILLRFYITPRAKKLGQSLGATQIDRFGNAGYRLIVHLIGIAAHFANNNPPTRSYSELTPGISEPAEKLLYLPAIVWAGIGVIDTIQAARKPKMAGEGADMIFHHALTIVLIVLSWYGGMQAYGAVLLSVHSIAEPFIDFYRLVSSCPNAPPLLQFVANSGAATVFPYTRIVTFYQKCIGPMLHVQNPSNLFVGCQIVMMPMFLLQVSVYLVGLGLCYFFLILRGKFQRSE